MRESFSLIPSGPPAVQLRTIEPRDLEDLRRWKNAARAAFFFKEEITPAGQQAWFQGYLARPLDFMFMAEACHLDAGCLGFRILDGAADAYNIIGAPAGRGRGLMSAAMRLMCSYILAEHSRTVACLVLKDNPAAAWYRKCGYRIAEERTDHYKMELDLSVFTPCAYIKSGKEPRP